MNGKHPEKHDYPASRVWREYYAESQPPPKLKKPKPKTIRVAGMTLHNIDPNAPIDDTTGPKLEENLKKLGLQPNTEKSPETPSSAPVEQTDFLHLVPASKGRQPKKINPNWHSDPERIMEIAADRHKRTRALASDAGHDATLRRQQLRLKLGLPEKAPPWKEMLLQFSALTEEDKDTLRDLGYHPERVTNPHSLTVERMLRDLQRYRGSK